MDCVRLLWVGLLARASVIRTHFFWGRSIGDLVLCVKSKVDVGRGSPSISLKIGMIKGEHSEAGNVDPGPYLYEKGSFLKGACTSPSVGRMA